MTEAQFEAVKVRNDVMREIINSYERIDRVLDLITKMMGRQDRLEARVKFLEDLRTA